MDRGTEADAQALVRRVVADRLHGETVDVERQAVIGGHGGNRCDDGAQVLLIEREVDGLQIDVTGGAAQPVGREENPSLQHQVAPVLGCGESGEEPFEHVEGEQLGRGPAALACLSLQGRVNLCRSHVRCSSAVRTGPLARGRALAIRMSSLGLAPRRPSHTRRASMPIS